MTAIAILPENPRTEEAGYRAIAGDVYSVGKTAGEALDALTAKLPESEKGTLIVVQHQQPDQFFTAQQQERLEELMTRWRTARDNRTALSVEDQAELEALVQTELQAATARAAALVNRLAK